MALTRRPLWASFLLAMMVLAASSSSSSASAFTAYPTLDTTTSTMNMIGKVQQPHHLQQCPAPAPPLVTMSAWRPSKNKKWWTRRFMLKANTSSSRPSSSSSSSILMDRGQVGTQKILVKNRARVTLDRETGEITKMTTSPLPPPSSDISARFSWSAFKETVYSAVDVVTSLPSKLNKKTPPKPVDGYSSSSTRRSKLVSGESPGDRLMKEYRSRYAKETPGTSAFEEFKKNIYSAVDNVANNNVVPPPNLSPTQKQTMQSFQPVVKTPTTTSLASLSSSSSVVKEALPDLRSKSPGKRWLAELKIRNWEEEQLKRRRRYRREQAAEKFKTGAYQVGDAVVDGFVAGWSSLVELPDRIRGASQSIQQASGELVQSVETTVETVKEIPKEVQEQVERSVETTKRVVQEVQGIPRKIQDISETLEDTVRTAREGVEETITNVKVFVGAEKKKPAPPKVPPPPTITARDVALKVAGGVITGTAKVAWWAASVGIEKVVGLVGAKIAQQQLAQQQQQRGVVTDELVDAVNVKVEKGSTATATFSEDNPQMTTFPDETVSNETKPKKESVSEIASLSNQELDIDALNLEVMDALELAEMAVRFADEGKNENGGNSALDEALRKATEAAILSTNEAAEIERNNMNKP